MAEQQLILTTRADLRAAFEDVVAQVLAQSSTPSPVLTVGEFAEAMKVDPVTVRAWITSGRVASIRERRTIRIPRTEIDRLVAEATRSVA